MNPSEITIVVYAARNLQSKKKGAVCQASVIFGIGKEKFRTEIVKGNDPTWNEESVINVGSQNASLTLTVMDKADALGSITIPVVQIPSAAHKRRWLPLTRKHQQTSIDLCFDCWVSKFKKDNVWNMFAALTTGGATSPQEKRRESIASASTGLKGSTSVLDICSKSLVEDRRESLTDQDKSRGLSESRRTSSNSDLNASSPRPVTVEKQVLSRPKILPTLGAVMSMKGPPEITGISPRFGPSSGGTKIIIRGCNLGRSQDDFLGCFICSCESLDTLEYHSPAKLVCVTKPWPGTKPNPGPVVLVTKSGGRGVSTVQFEYQGDPVRKRKDGVAEKGKTAKNDPQSALLKDVERLRQNVRDLTNENKSLKSYIDSLMVILMERFPEALEATAAIPRN